MGSSSSCSTCSSTSRTGGSTRGSGTTDVAGGTTALEADHLGRDALSRIIWGSRITLVVGLTAALLGDAIGFAWGISSGYLGGRFDLISQRLLDVLLSFPSLILALLLLAGIGAGLTTVII